MKPTRYIIAAFAAFCAAHAAWAWITYSSSDDFWPYGYESTGSDGIVFKSPATVTFTGSASYDWISLSNGIDTPVVFTATDLGNGLALSQRLYVGGGEGAGYGKFEAGTYSISGEWDVGEKATGIIEIAEGANVSAGTYICIGQAGNGTFRQTGGVFTNTAHVFIVGQGSTPGVTGTAEISGGVLNIKQLYVSENTTPGTMTVSGTAKVYMDNTTTAADAYIGGDIKGVLNINGGYMQVGTPANPKWLKFGGINRKGNGNNHEINLNGGVLDVCSICVGSGTGNKLTFNGGTLRAYMRDNAGLIQASSEMTVTVGDNGGTIDTAGFNIVVKQAIGGTGTLTIVGGGTVTFEASVSCPLKVEDGIVIGNGNLPANLTFGANGFVKYDLSSISATTEGEGEEAVTTLPASQTLASGVTIEVPAGDTATEHVIVKNDGTLAWTVSYEASSLTASAQLASAATPTMTVWTGDYEGDWSPQSGMKKTHWETSGNWVSGVPMSSTKAIFPSAAVVYMAGDKYHDCGDVILKTASTVTLYSQAQKQDNIGWSPKSVTGDGALRMGGIYLATHSAGPAMTIDVPIDVVHADHYTGSGTYTKNFPLNIVGQSGYPVTLNKTVTVPENVPLTIGANVVINGDMVINGTNTFEHTQEIKAGLSGSGVINGNFTTAAGAKVCATVTSAEGETTYLTVNGAADLANATVEVAGGELLADAEYGAEIVLLKATGEINWNVQDAVIGSGKWRVKTSPATYGDVQYSVLKAVKVAPGLLIIVR